jgi:cytochrome o ubiquinol oxidase operon protein cyoD
MDRELTFRLTGFIASLLLTLAAYSIILYPDFLHLDFKSAIIAIFILALVQSLVQLTFFINVWREKGAIWNFGVFVSTVSIIFIVIYFSIWIIDHLNYNMR